MKANKKAVEAPEADIPVAEQLKEFKEDMDVRFNNLGKQIQTVSDRVTDVEEALPRRSAAVSFSGADDVNPRTPSVGPSPTQQSRIRADSVKSVAFDPQVTIERDERRRGTGPSASASSASDDAASSATFDDSQGEQMPLLSNRSAKRNGTIFGQAKIASELSLPVRLLGICLAFLTIVLVWETTDMLMSRVFPHKEVLQIAYLSLVVLAAVCLALSHAWVDNADSTLVPSFAYAISTLFLAIGSWGTVKTAVDVLVPRKMQLFCYGLGAVVALFFTGMYALQTKHNVLLDIAGCATSMGMHDQVIASMSTSPAQFSKSEFDITKAWSVP